MSYIFEIGILRIFFGNLRIDNGFTSFLPSVHVFLSLDLIIILLIIIILILCTMLFCRTGPSHTFNRGDKKREHKYNNGQVRIKDTDSELFKMLHVEYSHHTD